MAKKMEMELKVGLFVTIGVGFTASGSWCSEARRAFCSVRCITTPIFPQPRV